MTDLVVTGLFVVVGFWSLLSILFFWSYHTSQPTRDA